MEQVETKAAQQESYAIFNPRECGLLDVFLSLFPDAAAPSTRCSPGLRERVDSSWQAKFAMLMMTLLRTAARGLAMVGRFIELWLNTFHINGGVLKMLFRIASGSALLVPQEGSEDYLSFIGLLDPRTDLLLQESCDNFRDQSSFFANESPASKLLADACMMAAKLAYENPKAIEKVVTEYWKMHLIGVFNGLNKYQPRNSTQFFIVTDREEDAQAIILAFRGIMPFNAYNWSTNFDFSWYELSELGRLHVGSLEALSLVDRQDMSTFSRLKRNISEKRARVKQQGQETEIPEVQREEESREYHEAEGAARFYQFYSRLERDFKNTKVTHFDEDGSLIPENRGDKLSLSNVFIAGLKKNILEKQESMNAESSYVEAAKSSSEEAVRSGVVEDANVENISTDTVGGVEQAGLVPEIIENVAENITTDATETKYPEKQATGGIKTRLLLSGLSEASNEESKHLLAYDCASAKLKELLTIHKNAKVFVTGHSLGGAVATVFTSILFHNREDEITSKLAAVYTFGQPKAGDREFAANMTVNLNQPENRYFRVAYSNDLVTRLPYEDLVFQFKHLGPCFFYGSNYKGETVKEEPDKSFTSANLLPTHAAATWELVQSFMLQYKFGEAYKETVASTAFRLVGLIFPGIAAHSPVNYVNAIRLGSEVLDPEVMPSPDDVI